LIFSAEITLPLFAAFFVVFIIAGTIKGTVGIGLPTASVGLMAQFADPKLAIAVVVIPIVVLNGWQAYRAGGFIETLRRYALFAAFMIPVLFVTTFFTARIDGQVLIFWLGVVVVLFSATSLFITPPPLPDRYDKAGQAVAGTVAGVLGGLTAIWAPPVMIYLLSRKIEKTDFVRASGTILFCGSFPLFLGSINSGLLDRSTAILSAMMLIPALIGFWFGEKLRQRLDAELFRTIVLVVFLLMGLNLMRRSLFG
jgi:hypothetical protein